MLSILLLLVTSATAAVVQMPGPRAVEALPSSAILPAYLDGAKNRATIALPDVASITSTTHTAALTPTPTSTRKSTHKSTKTKTKTSHKRTSTTSPTISITASASLELLVAIPNCTPSTICVDAMTCSQRYGACYDKNYCDGNTSPYPIPTCTADAGADLTSNHVVTERNDTFGGSDAVVEAKI
ncbi:hypothetical protein LTR91_004822 [Friedmanniomyces endolithicus]|uniref:Uncharacterized protein n=1 Tax=Friedmanniomyces endolithicus TaxID=329885 RepID=A0AAN6JEM3_9PEZI|nr:hypothetical protein LTS00_015353 [Friedmanniomyces endolithicus]KAK0280327.1 hypothetical protein LTR35_007968 [Friedmanniomyces endolithicus]KAK0326866.1 hypothetical protein LTR82_001626 [Friedmanniomyces endolithicus]KAK0926337.1 hypothetical protein LTR57_004194 [Friedmanniomyces endolithicus]KAK0936887.1 hypothetical protein LTR29_011566 [Friedmanniomyces endolithicus]